MVIEVSLLSLIFVHIFHLIDGHTVASVIPVPVITGNRIAKLYLDSCNRVVKCDFANI